MNYMILEQRLGGKLEGEFGERTLTDIDQSLLRGLIEHMLGDLKAAWAKVVTVEPALEDSTTNQHWVQMVMGNERVMLLTFEINMANVTGTMSIFIPFSTLKPIATCSIRTSGSPDAKNSSPTRMRAKPP
jgi:flagellar motor switch protein FliM